MEDKWIFISRVLEDMNYKASAAMARVIHYVLKKMYGKTETKVWKEYRSELEKVLYISMKKEKKLNLVREVADNAGFCIACEESFFNCKDCEFGKLFGYCNEKKSLYRMFFRVLELEHGNKVEDERIDFNNFNEWIEENKEEDDGYIMYKYGV